MNERFMVAEAGKLPNVYYWIRDMECQRWNLPEHATTLNFGLKEHADKVAEILNRSWQSFLRHPI